MYINVGQKYASLATAPSADNSFSQTSETPSGTARNTILQQSDDKVNGSLSLSESDEAYMQAVENGDTDTAARMV